MDGHGGWQGWFPQTDQNGEVSAPSYPYINGAAHCPELSQWERCSLLQCSFLPPPSFWLSLRYLAEDSIPNYLLLFFKNKYTSSTTLQSSLLGPPLPPAICLSVGCLCLIHPRTVALKENTGTLKPWNRVGSAPKMDVNAPEQSKPAFPMVRKDSSQKPAILRERRSRLTNPLSLTSPLDRRSLRNRGGQTKLKRVLIGIAGIDDICVSKHNMYNLFWVVSMDSVQVCTFQEQVPREFSLQRK